MCHQRAGHRESALRPRARAGLVRSMWHQRAKQAEGAEGRSARLRSRAALGNTGASAALLALVSACSADDSDAELGVYEPVAAQPTVSAPLEPVPTNSPPAMSSTAEPPSPIPTVQPAGS